MRPTRLCSFTRAEYHNLLSIALLMQKMKTVMLSSVSVAMAAPSFSAWMAAEGKTYATKEELVLRRVSSPYTCVSASALRRPPLACAAKPPLGLIIR